MKNFTAGDVVTMGISLERTAASFYNQAAKKTADEATQKLLKGLAAMELDHEKALLAVQRELTQSEVSTAQDMAQAQVRLSALASGPFLSFKANPNVRLSGQESLSEILQIALGMEENAIVLMTELAKVVPADAGRQHVEDLLREELKHRDLIQQHLARCAPSSAPPPPPEAQKKTRWQRLFGKD